MRLRILALVSALATVAAVAVVAVASTSANGLPTYTNGYTKWPRINKKSFTSTGPLSSAHAGVKNVYTSKRKVGKRYPNGTVIVKSIRRAGDTSLPAQQVAVMRKTNGAWRYAEYELSGSRYRDLGLSQQLCQGCHMQARANDYVFTK